MEDGGIEVEGNDKPDGEGQGQFALSWGSKAMLDEGVMDSALRNDLGQSLDGQSLTELALSFNLSYGKSHEVAPVLHTFGVRTRKYATEVTSSTICKVLPLTPLPRPQGHPGEGNQDPSKLPVAL